MRETPEGGKGLFRDLLSSDGHSLKSAFEALKHSPDVSRLAEHEGRGLLGASVEVAPEEGAGHWSFFNINNDIFVVVSDFTYQDARTETIEGEGLLEFHIKLSGHLNLSGQRTELVEVDGPTLLVWSQPEGVEADEWMEPNLPEKSVTIYCRASYLRENLVGDSIQMPKALKQFVSSDAESISHCQFPITPAILQCATDLANSDEMFDGPYWLIYVEAKALELLAVILTAFDKLSIKVEGTYRPQELEIFDQAKAIIETEFHPVPTIRRMARRLGINETKLKSGFKAVFGMTIFEYRNKVRMNLAKELLDSGEVQVGVVAEKVGYQHQTTFTTVFKTYFGLNPKDYKKLRKTD